ncbi:MAG: phenylacetate--CoA ligase [Thermoguttaceae bacterium]|nr:phenylacetate--CoA ligase [Thermoguttaceae bacterium]
MEASQYLNPQEETASVDQLRAWQLERLQKIVRHVWRNAAFRKLFEEQGVGPDDVKTLEDITKLPMVSKDIFRQTYPLGLCCVDEREIAEMHMSSGSTGTPVVMPYTRNDLTQWGECMARCYRMAGAQPGDVTQITPTFGLFNGGFGFYHGARTAGLFIVPASSGHTQRQVTLAKDFGTKVFGAVVSYGIRFLEERNAMGIELPAMKIGIFGAETFSDELKKRLTAGLEIEAFDIYGMTETGGVGTLGQDCSAHNGIHVWEDHYLAEVLDPMTHKPVADGQVGELTITSLTREALPVIRFRTGDLTRILSRERCACGRTHLRIAPVTGRIDDMLIVKGVNFFPRQVEQALLEIPGVLPNYQIIIEERDGVKDVRIHVEAEAGVTGYMVEKHLKERLQFSPKGDVFAPGTLPRQEGKAQRVFYEKKD